MGKLTNQPINLSTLLRTDPAWSVYALADLAPRFAHVCRWTVAGDGVVLLFAGLTPPILFTHGPAADVAEALAQAHLPERVYLSVREEHLPGVQRWYDTSADYRPMWRMVWRGGAEAGGAQARGAEAPNGLVRLGVEDAGRIEALYAHGGDFAPDAFDPSQLADGTFWGVVAEKSPQKSPEKFDFWQKSNFWDGADLLAAGGTHVVDSAERVAVIGNIYARPDHRGRGYAKAITRAITAHLQQRGIDLIVLNVDQRNLAAVNLYEQLGFVKHCPFVEGEAMSKE